MTNNRYIQLLKNTGIVFIGNAGSKLLMFFMLPLYTKWLSPAEYGVADMVVVYGTMLIGLVTCQVHDAIFVFPKNQSIEKQSAYFSGGLHFLILVYVGLVPIFMLLYWLIPHSCVFIKYLPYVYMFLLLDGFALYLQQFSRSVDKLMVYSMSGLAITVVSVFVSCLLLPSYGRAEFFILGQCAGFAAGITVAAVFSNARKYLRWQKNKACLFEMLRYSLPMVPTAVMWWAMTSLNRPFMEHFCSLSDIGRYAAAVKIAAILTAVWGIVGNAWQISVFDEFKKSDFWSYFLRMFIITLAVIAGVGLTLSVLAPWYMSFVVGEGFYLAYKYIPLLMTGTCFTIMSGFVGILFQVHKKSIYYLYCSVVSLAVIVVANIGFIPKFGAFGACGAVAVAAFVEFILRIIMSVHLWMRRS